MSLGFLLDTTWRIFLYEYSLTAPQKMSLLYAAKIYYQYCIVNDRRIHKPTSTGAVLSLVCPALSLIRGSAVPAHKIIILYNYTGHTAGNCVKSNTDSAHYVEQPLEGAPSQTLCYTVSIRKSLRLEE